MSTGSDRATDERLRGAEDLNVSRIAGNGSYLPEPEILTNADLERLVDPATNGSAPDTGSSQRSCGGRGRDPNPRSGRAHAARPRHGFGGVSARRT